MPTVGWFFRLEARQVPAMQTKQASSTMAMRPSLPLVLSIIKIPLSLTYRLPFVAARLRAEVAELLLEALGRLG